MNIKIYLLLLTLLSIITAQVKYEYWQPNKEYKTEAGILFQGIRYGASFENTTQPGTQNEEEEYPWDRFFQSKAYVESGLAKTRFGPYTHRKISRMLREDPFVYAIANEVGADLKNLQDVGISCEEDYLRIIYGFSNADFLHSAWGTFMENRSYLQYGNYEYAFEQIMHNIGDAGVTFGHALGDKSKASNHGTYTDANGDEKEFTSGSKGDERECANEYWGRKGLNSNDERDDMIASYITGTIYDVINTYESRVDSAIKWALDNIPKCTGTRIHCADEDATDYQTLVNGTGDPVWGVTRTAIAAGRMVLIDAMLATQPLINQKIIGKGNISTIENSQYTFTAFAKDPDAVKFELLAGKPLNSKTAADYRLQHYNNIHPMDFEWDINGDGIYTDYVGENDPKNNIIGDKITLKVISSQIVTTNEIKSGTIVLEPSIGNQISVNVENSSFKLSVKITDDEGSNIIATKSISLLDRPPVPVFTLTKERNSNSYVALLNSTSFATSFAQENGLTVSSGFKNPLCLKDVFIDADQSVDADGNASDQITNINYDFDNTVPKTEEWALLGVNQSKTIDNTDEISGKEEQIFLNGKLSFSTENDKVIKGSYKYHYLSSTWNNDGSPETTTLDYSVILPNEQYSFTGSIIDDEGNAQSKVISLPIITPPTISSASMAIDHLIEKDIPPVVYTNTAITLGFKDEVISFSANAYDEDNKGSTPSEKGGVISYEWGFKVQGSDDDVSMANPNWNSPFRGATAMFTYHELIDWDILPEVKYEIILKVTDDDAKITGIADGCGVTMYKVGEIKLAKPLIGDTNYDGFVNEYDE